MPSTMQVQPNAALHNPLRCAGPPPCHVQLSLHNRPLALYGPVRKCTPALYDPVRKCTPRPLVLRSTSQPRALRDLPTKKRSSRHAMHNFRHATRSSRRAMRSFRHAKRSFHHANAWLSRIGNFGKLCNKCTKSTQRLGCPRADAPHFCVARPGDQYGKTGPRLRLGFCFDVCAQLLSGSRHCEYLALHEIRSF